MGWPADERLEYPLPVLSVDTDNIVIETKDRLEGRLRIKNIGGAELSGYMVSRDDCIGFEPAEWIGNDVEIAYRFNPDASGMKPGEVLESAAYVCSNGGEKKLSVTVRLIKMAIYTDEGTTLANIQDFFAYAQVNPIKAQRLFTGSDFYMLLLSTGYPYMEAYEMMHRDTNRERAMDNFFILSGLKQKTALSFPQPELTFVRKPHEDGLLYGHFLVQKSDTGFVEAPVSKRHQTPWLNLPASRLISNDFNEANMAMVKFSIDPAKIEGRFAKESVMVGADAVDVVFKRSNPLSIRLDREAYRFDDSGVIHITNHTGGELGVDVFCQDSYIRFAAKMYMVGEAYEIPFEVKMSAFMTAQLLFRKLPFLRTTIEIKTLYRDTFIKKQLPLVIGKL